MVPFENDNNEVKTKRFIYSFIYLFTFVCEFTHSKSSVVACSLVVRDSVVHSVDSSVKSNRMY